MTPPHVSAQRGFSLLEVVVAVGILAVGVVAVLSLFVPVTRSAATVAEAEMATRVAEAVRVRLRTMPFETAAALIQDEPGSPRRAVIFAKLDGEIGVFDSAVGREAWYDAANTRLTAADKYFAIDLVRNTKVSPKQADATAASIAFTMRVRWPALADGIGLPAEEGGQRALFFNGCISR